MNISIGDRWQLRPRDSLNWLLFEFRPDDEVDGDVDGGDCWKSTGRYYQHLSAALSAVYEMELKKSRRGDLVSLDEAVVQCRSIADEVVASANDIKLSNLGGGAAKGKRSM